MNVLSKEEIWAKVVIIFIFTFFALGICVMIGGITIPQAWLSLFLTNMGSLGLAILLIHTDPITTESEEIGDSSTKEE